MFLVSEAIVVGRRMFANTSLVLRCYTERAGGLTVLAKGVFRRRRRAEPPSVPDLFERGELVLSLAPAKGYSILREWCLEDVRKGVRERPDAFRAASGCAALVAALSGEPAPGGEHFAALDEALGELDRGGEARPVLWAFALGVLSRAGFLAPLDSCALCGVAFGTARGPTRGEGRREAAAASPSAGGFVCPDCEPRAEGRIELPPEAASAARFLSRAGMDAAGRLRCSAGASMALDRAVRAFAEHNLERELPELSLGEEEP